MIAKTARWRYCLLSGLLLLSLNSRAYEFKSTPLKADSNAKITLLNDPASGEVHSRVELFWTFDPGEHDGVPQKILLFFQIPPEGNPGEKPELTHCYVNHQAIPDPQWIPGRGFEVPLSSPLFPGTRIHLECLFSFTLKKPVAQGILPPFYPSIPCWQEGKWIVPPEFQAVFPSGTSHILTLNSQTPLVIPRIFQRKAAENHPELMNGCSIAINSEILQVLQWHETKLLLSPSWNAEQVLQSLETVRRHIPASWPSQWIVLKGRNRTGWGMCSARNQEDLSEVLFKSMMTMNYPVLQPVNEDAYHDLWVFLSSRRPSAFNLFFRSCFLPDPERKSRTPLSCFLNHSPQRKIQRQLHDWLNTGTGRLISLERIFELETYYPEAEISILREDPEDSYTYRFNADALLACPLFLIDIDGNYALKQGRTRVTETFPAPLDRWQTGLSFTRKGTLNNSATLLTQKKQKNDRENLWKSLLLQWLL